MFIVFVYFVLTINNILVIMNTMSRVYYLHFNVTYITLFDLILLILKNNEKLFHDIKCYYIIMYYFFALSK